MTGKAILVIDMPSCCDECFALDDNGDYPFCLITHEQMGYKFRTRERKMPKCPFKLVPEKTEVNNLCGVCYNQCCDKWERGYNACIDDILK